MSYIENNKAWILPLLGVGTAGVIWMNVRTFNPPPSTAQETLPPAGAPAASPAAAAPPTVTPPLPPVPDGNQSLWDDLRPVAFVPAALEASATFEQNALSSLPSGAFSAPGLASVVRPVGPEPRQNAPRASLPGTGTPAAALAVAPPPDFLIDGPGGAQAWFEGQGYHTGQALKGHPFQVQGIRILPWPQVTLQGPAGSTTHSTRPAPVQEHP